MSAAINNPINEGKAEWTGVETLPSLIFNPEVSSVGENCQEEMGVVCDLHYKLDWDYLLEVKTSCLDLSTGDVDPCFATFACICANGYYRFAENMPEPTGTYLGSSNSLTFQLLTEALKEKSDTVEDELITVTEEPTSGTDDSDDSWVIFVIIVGVIVGLAGLGAAIFFYIRRNRANKNRFGDS